MSDIMWTRDAECVGTEVEDALVLLDLDGGSYFALNGPAADIWEALAEPVSQAQLVDRLVAKYRVSPEQCAASVARVLDDLAGKGLARRAG
ncbi:MAG: PqqD family protein [Sphingomonas bacterium]